MDTISENEKVKFENLATNLKYAKYYNVLSKWKVLRTSDFITLCEGISQPSIIRHLKEMNTNGVLKSIKVNGFSKENIHLLNERYSLANGIGQTSSSLFHSLTLNSFIIGFKDLFGPYIDEIFLEHEIKSYSQKGNVEPDGIIKIKFNNSSCINIAIENEVTQKSEIRFREKLLKYHTNKEFHFVLYVFENKKIYEAYERVFKKSMNERSSHPEHIYFLNLTEFLSLKESKASCRLTNFEENYTLSEFLKEVSDGAIK